MKSSDTGADKFVLTYMEKSQCFKCMQVLIKPFCFIIWEMGMSIETCFYSRLSPWKREDGDSLRFSGRKQSVSTSQCC